MFKKSLLRAQVSSIFFVSVVTLLTACGRGGFDSQDAVLVDWNEDNWHKAVVLEECDEDEGWIVDFEDDFYDTSKEGVAVCYPESKIIYDEVPSIEDLTVGDEVLAQWVEDAYYRAKISKIQDDGISVIFTEDEFDTKIEVDALRLL
ncbi:MAG: hypothetical protein AAB373_06770 [Patescibacteria group bacterium]